MENARKLAIIQGHAMAEVGIDDVFGTMLIWL